MAFSIRTLSKMILIIFSFTLLFSCSTSNQVVSNKLFQKRKYQKGWHINSPNSFRKEKGEEELAFNSISKELKDDNTIIKEEEINKNISNEIEISDKVYQKKKTSQLDLFPAQEKKELHSNIGLSLKDIAKENKSYSRLMNQEAESVPIDRSNKLTRFLLVLLALAFLYFTQIGPLAILIGAGRVESLKVNLLIWLLGIILLAIGFFSVLITSALIFTPTSIGLLIAGGVIILAANIHAVVVIIRGY